MMTQTNDPTTQPVHSSRSHRWMSRTAPLLVIAATAAATITATATSAMSDDGAASLYVPMTPCRLLDTRPGPDQVGGRSTPIGAGETYVQPVTGTHGNCVVPDDATAIAMNATAVGATAPSFATFFPSGATQPLASNLNYLPGQAPSPNKVDVQLGGDGSIGVYNAFGTVDMVIDVTGYYSDGPIRELETSLAAKADVASVYTKAEVDGLLSSVAAEAAAGHSDAEIEALLDELASKDEVGNAIAAIGGAVYTRDEIDDMHDLVYTKDEVDGRLALVYSRAEIDALLDERITRIAGFNSAGGKLVPGFYTSSKQLIGHYRVTFDVGDLELPIAKHFVVVATSRCDGVTVANTARTVHAAGAVMDELDVDLRATNVAGIPQDCALDVMVRFDAT